MQSALRLVKLITQFFNVTGSAPIDESAILLQRLPYLGRVGSGSSDRIFIDDYAKDGLRGMAMTEAVRASDKRIAQTKWLQPIGEFGLKVLASGIVAGAEVEKYIRLCLNHGNSQLACDYVCLKLMQSAQECDLTGISVSEGKINVLNFSELIVVGLNLCAIDIETVVVESTTFRNVQIEHCLIRLVNGAGSADKLPGVFVDCIVEKFQAALTISRISELHLPNAHKTLLALIKKLFFQKGGGRQEEALLRGAEDYWDSAVADDILRYMQTNDIIKKVAGNHGTLFVPRRSHTRRMAKIWELQSNCGDELWKRLGS